MRSRAALLGVSIEDAGRGARYEFLERVATELGADVIATGHTRDDQAETFLLRLLRGAGPRGLAGIHPRAGRVVRPVLEIARDELRAYLAVLGQSFREDESNRDLSIPRNQVRHELLPLLSRDYSPGIIDVLAREAAIARQDEDRLQLEAIDLLGLIVLRNERAGRDDAEALELDAGALAALHPALAVASSAWCSAVRSRRDSLARSTWIGCSSSREVRGTASALSLPGQRAVRRGHSLVIDRCRPPEPFANSFRVLLSIPGEAVFGAWEISAAGDTQSGHSRGHSRGTLKGPPLSVPGLTSRSTC